MRSVRDFKDNLGKIAGKKLLENVDGVKLANVSYDTKLALVTFDDEKATIKALTDATTNAGYPSKKVK